MDRSQSATGRATTTAGIASAETVQANNFATAAGLHASAVTAGTSSSSIASAGAN